MDADKTVTANFAQIIVIDESSLHANLSKKDVVTEDRWNLHVWANITNVSSQTFVGQLRIKSSQPGPPEITKYYPEIGYAPISIVPGKSKYPTGIDYWLMSEVGIGSAPKDVKVEIWIYDTLGNTVAYVSKFAN
jgi:hypothetical protein